MRFSTHGSISRQHKSFRENELLRGDPNQSRLNACVGLNGGPYDNYDFAIGYLKGSGLILSGARDWSIEVDLAIHPACLLFRHGVELYLKHLPRVLGPQLGERGTIARKAKERPSHGLVDLWDDARSDLRSAGVDIRPGEAEHVQLVVACFDEVDPRGDVFRYPESIKKDLHLKEWSLINAAVLDRHRAHFLEIAREWQWRITGSA